jgi:hypothetical protein
MTIYPFRSSLAVILLALTGGGCSSSSQKNDGTVPDGSSEARGSRPSLTASPSTLLNFGSVCPGTVSAPQTVQIMNIGDSAVPVDVKVTGINAADFTTTETGCDLIAPGATCTIAVVFASTTASTGMATLEVISPGGDLLRISLGGTSTGGPAPFSLSPSSYDFGSVAVGTTSSAVTFTVAVQGALTCSNAAAVSPFVVMLSNTEFVVTNDSCSENAIPIGGTCTFSVVFSPISAGAKYAPLLVGWPSYARTLPLLGTGIAIVDAGLPEPMDSPATTRHLRP